MTDKTNTTKIQRPHQINVHLSDEELAAVNNLRISLAPGIILTPAQVIRLLLVENEK